MGMPGNNMLDGVLARSTSRIRLHWLKGSLSPYEGKCDGCVVVISMG